MFKTFLILKVSELSKLFYNFQSVSKVNGQGQWSKIISNFSKFMSEISQRSRSFQNFSKFFVRSKCFSNRVQLQFLSKFFLIKISITLSLIYSFCYFVYLGHVFGVE